MIAMLLSVSLSFAQTSCDEIADPALRYACTVRAEASQRIDLVKTETRRNGERIDEVAMATADLDARLDAVETRPESAPPAAPGTTSAPIAAPAMQGIPFSVSRPPAAAMTGDRPSMNGTLTIEDVGEVEGAGAMICARANGQMTAIVGPETQELFVDLRPDGVLNPSPQPIRCASALAGNIHIVAPAGGEATLFYMIPSTQTLSGYPVWIVEREMLYRSDSDGHRPARVGGGFQQFKRTSALKGEL